MRVVLPLIAPAILACFVIAFVIALNEHVRTMCPAAPGNDTLPKVLWPQLRCTLTPIVAAPSTVSRAATLFTLVVGALIWRRLSRLQML